MKKRKLRKNKQSSDNSQLFAKSLSLRHQEMLMGGTSVENSGSKLVCVDCEAVATGDTVRIPVRIKYEL